MKNTEENDYTSLIALEAMIESSFKTIRGKRVMLCSDVAKLYRVSPDVLLKQVKKNIDRFPEEYFFKLKANEEKLFQTEKYPYAFTEHTILMMGGVLKSKEAREIHIQVICYFVQLFNRALKDASMLQKIEPHIKGDKIFDVLKEMLK